MFHVYQLTSWPLPWFHIESIFSTAFGGVFFAQLSDGSLEVKALKIGRKETFFKRLSWLLKTPDMNGSLGHLRYSLARQLYGNFSRQSRKEGNESFHKLVVDGSDKCFPTWIRSQHTVDHLPLTSRTKHFEIVEKLKRNFRAEISSKHRKLQMQAWGKQAGRQPGSRCHHTERQLSEACKQVSDTFAM